MLINRISGSWRTLFSAFLLLHPLMETPLSAADTPAAPPKKGGIAEAKKTKKGSEKTASSTADKAKKGDKSTPSTPDSGDKKTESEKGEEVAEEEKLEIPRKITLFRCPSCHFTQDIRGQCPDDNLGLIEVIPGSEERELLAFEEPEKNLAELDLLFFKELAAPKEIPDATRPTVEKTKP